MYTPHYTRISPMRQAADYLVRTRASCNEINDAERLGALSHRGASAARFFWRWSTVHYSDAKQDRAYERLGAAAYRRRIERVKALMYRLAR
jgi:hypothetical protein